MCGIFFTSKDEYGAHDTLQQFLKLTHRGPDGWQLLKFNKMSFGFHRLSIINPKSGINQPIQKNEIIVICNGEIYNWQILIKTYLLPKVKSDCEIIPYLYDVCGRDFLKMVKLLDGEFAIVLYDVNQHAIYAARDFMGIRPLYYNKYKNDVLTIASELKAIHDTADHILPRKVYRFDLTTKQSVTTTYWSFPLNITYPSLSKMIKEIYSKLYKSIYLRLESDKPVGCLLSGGLDSSIIAAMAASIKPRIPCFVIGMEDSDDIISAKKVADFIGCPLHVVPFNPDEGVFQLSNVINALETYDVTTIRASTPQYLLAKWIKENTDIRVILSGEGSDELFAGYIYSKLAPNAYELKQDRIRLLSELYLYDCLRTDRSTAAHGLEVRVPFLQKDLINCVLEYNPQYFMSGQFEGNIEKALLREMCRMYNLLPVDIINRPKEAFSDAVSGSFNNKKTTWKSYIQQNICSVYKQHYKTTHSLLPRASMVFNTNEQNEKDLYLKIFNQLYPNKKNVLPKYWMPNWCNVNDPSATVLHVYHKN